MLKRTHLEGVGRQYNSYTRLSKKRVSLGRTTHVCGGQTDRQWVGDYHVILLMQMNSSNGTDKESVLKVM